MRFREIVNCVSICKMICFEGRLCLHIVDVELDLISNTNYTVSAEMGVI